MRILFLSTNRFRIEVAQPMPIGLACVIASIDEAAHAVEVLDLMFSEDPFGGAHGCTRAASGQSWWRSPSGIPTTSPISPPQYFLPEAKQMIDLCRSVSRAKIVVGGAAFTTVPEALFDYLEPDFGIAGDGEISFPRLVECIENGTDWSEVPGLVWRANGRIRANAPAFVEDWGGLPLPRRDLFDLQKYAEVGGALEHRGQPGLPHALSLLRRSASPGEEAAQKARRAGDRRARRHERNEASDTPIFFTAPIFNSPASNAKKVCRGIIERGLKIRWTALIHPAFLDDELAELMQRSGCAAVSLACDSCSERMLKTLRKDITKQQLEAAIALPGEARDPLPAHDPLRRPR